MSHFQPTTAVTGMIVGAALVLGVQHLPSLTTAAPQPKAAEPEARDLYLVLNGAFRAAYARTKKDLLKSADPILLEEGGTLVMLHKGKRTESKYLSARYDDVKTICHIPLSLYVMLVDKTDLTDDQLADLARYRTKVVDARKSLKERGFEAALLEKQEKLVAESLAFLDGIVTRKKVTETELTAFTRATGKQMMPLIAAVARIQIDGLNAQVKEYRTQLSDAEWKRLKVVLMGSAMPRKEQICLQYFARLLGEPGEGRRIVYAEGLWSEDKALDLLGKHLLDAPIGSAFFDDDRRMMRDLLADAAKDYLNKKELGGR